MEINPTIFKSYDIRGIYPSQLNEKIAYRIGQVFIEHTKAKRVAIGRDCRLSSPSLFKALSKGIIDRGADVYNIGEVPTECLYFTVGNYDYDGGIMITASHNPKEYNGFKMVKKKVGVIRGEEIGRIFEKADFSEVKRTGKIKNIDIWQDWLNHIFSFVDINKIKPLKVAVDASNGMAGKTISRISPKIPIELIPLNFNLDGNFPAHAPNPLLEESSLQIKKEIKTKKADLGFIFDGDADRIFLLDEKGRFIKGDVTLLLLSKYFLEKIPGAGIVYNVICSKAVPEFIKKWNGRPIQSPVGFINIKENMIKNRGIMGGELAGHYSFKGNFYSDSGFIAFLILLEIISASRKKVSAQISGLSPYAKTSEINFEIKEKEKILNKIKKLYSDGKQNYLDGITVEYDNWWFNVRPSNTEPLIRLTIEANTKELLEEKKKELIALIKKEK